MSLPTLSTERLHLPPLDAHDLALYCALYCSAEVMQHIAVPLEAAAAERSFARALRYNAQTPWQRRFWSMRERAGGQPIGLLALSRVEAAEASGAATAEIGAMILPAFQARGYAAEAITRLVEHAFDDAEVERLITRHVAANPLATGLMRKLGFALERDGDACLWQRDASTSLL